MTRRTSLGILLAIVVCTAAHTSPAEATTFTVDTIADDAAETGCDDATPDDCSLRGAVARANGNPGRDTIVVPAGTYVIQNASPCTFETVQGDPVHGSSVIPLCLSGDVEIVGAGSDQTILQGGGQDRFFAVSKLTKVGITGVTMTGGRTGFGYAIGGGAAINNQGTLTLTASVVSACQTPQSGGAIFNVGDLTIQGCTITGNSAGSTGGGIHTQYNLSKATSLTIVDSTFSANSANVGGAVYNDYSSTTAIGSVFEGNTGSVGSGIGEHGGEVVLVNSTISGNTGSGVDVGRSSPAQSSILRLRNVTIARNTGYGAGGIDINGDQLVTMRNTIIAENHATSNFAPDVAGTLTSEGYNLVGNTKNTAIVGDTTGNLTNVAARLGDLFANGGPTKTHVPLPADGTHAASPAIDAGNPAAPGSGGTACAATDQRGFLRPVGVRCDIGAVEAVSAFELVGVLPARGGVGGTVVVRVAGSAIDPDAVLRFERAGQPTIVPAFTEVDEGGLAIKATLDLTGVAEGAWDAVVENPGGESRRLDAAFLVEPERKADVWMQVYGPSGMRAGVPTLFTLVYGNRGNVDALAVPITLSLAEGMGYRLAFPIGAPPLVDSAIELDWQLQPIDVELDANAGTTNLALLLPVVPAGSTSTLQVLMTLPPSLPHGGTVTSFAAAGTPLLLTPESSDAAVNALVASARAYAKRVLFTDVPDAAGPDLAEHARAQLDAIVDEGHALLVQTDGVAQRVHSLAWIELELALRGTKAVLEAEANASLSREGLFAALADSLRTRVAEANEAPGGICPIVSCKKAGSRLYGGCSCTDLTCDGSGGASDQGCFPPPIPGPPECGFKEKMTVSQFLEMLKKCKMDKDRCEALPNHHVATNDDGQQFCVPNDPSRHCPQITIPNPLGAGSLDCLGTPIKSSHDPNDKTGVAGIGDDHFLVPGTPLAYGISFENDVQFANAAAQVVTITDQLDPAKVDLATFSLGAMTFGAQLVPVPPGVQTFSGGVDLRPAQNLIVTIEAGLNPETGLVHWTFTSVDPETMQLTTDADAGFLPPNAAPPEGEGSVSFTIAPKADVAAGTTICNAASIVFDVNAPIATPTWCNTFDMTPPASTVAALPALTIGSDVPLSWSGTDAGAGVVAYTVYVSTDGGPFTPFLEQTTETAATFPGVPGSTYAFYSVAEDGLGNREAIPPTPDATTELAGPDGPRELAITAVKGPKSVKLKGAATTKAVTVKIQNQGAAALTIPTADALATLVGIEIESLGACTAPAGALKAPRALAKTPIVLKPKKTVGVSFDVTFACANDGTKGTPDYRVVARLGAFGGGDGHAEDDVCPRPPSVLPDGGPVTRPAGTFKDRGCGARLGKKTFGAPVAVDVVVPAPR